MLYLRFIIRFSRKNKLSEKESIDTNDTELIPSLPAVVLSGKRVAIKVRANGSQ